MPIFPDKTLIILFSLIAFCSCGGMDSQEEGTEESTALPSTATINPSNAKLIFLEDFENGKASSGWTEVNFVENNYRNIPKFINIAGKWAAHYHLIGGQGTENEQQPLTILKQDSTSWFGTKSIDEIYIEHSEYFENNYDFPTGSQKMLRIGRFVEYSPDGPFIDFWNQVSNTNIQIFHYFKAGDSITENENFYNTNIGLETERWIRFGTWVKLNSPGQSNGFARLYKDGELIASIEDANLRGNNQKGYEFFWIGGNATYWQPGISNGHMPNPENNSSRYIAEIRVYNTKP